MATSSQHQFQVTTYPAHSNPYSFAQPLHSYTTTTPYYRQQTHATPGQGTLSPQVLHSTNSLMSAGVHPQLYYGALPPAASTSTSTSSTNSTTISPPPATAPQPSPSQQLQNQQQLIQQQQQLQAEQQARDKKERFEKSIRPLLQSNAFTGAGAVQNLVDKITDYGIDLVEPALRLEIATKMRDGAPNHYFRAWSENQDALEITKDWLKAALKENSPQLLETAMPILHVREQITPIQRPPEPNFVIDSGPTAVHSRNSFKLKDRKTCPSYQQDDNYPW